MVVLWNEEYSGWIKVDSIETMGVLPIDVWGNFTAEDGKIANYMLFAERANKEPFVVLVRDTAGKAEEVLKDISCQLGVYPESGEPTLVEGEENLFL